MRRAVPAAVLLAVAVLSGCSSTGSPATAAPAPAPPPMLAASAAEAAVLAAGDRVQVDATGGVLTRVTLTDQSGGVVADAGDADTTPPAPPTELGATWTAPDVLRPARSYTLSASAVGPEGARTQLLRKFTTGAPASTLSIDTYPFGNQVVGVGHPLVVKLSVPVADPKRRALVERALVVSSSVPVAEAGWAWLSSTQLQYRPRTFWLAGSTVTLDANLAGLDVGDGLWGMTSRQVRFKTGDAQVLTIDNATHKAVFTINGKAVKTMPISLGKPGYETRSGTKVVMTRHETYRMRSSTLGVDSGPDSYDLEVKYAMRLTNSGEFLHGAPWARSRLGRVNGSHGCTNLSDADARWLYEHVRIGDPVITTGTGRAAEADNGLGGVWNLPWELWLSKSAQVAATGSRLSAQ